MYLKCLHHWTPVRLSALTILARAYLKYSYVAIFNPLYHLFSLCLFQHNIHSDWRLHPITPINKSGDKVSNYRPISRLSCTSKVLERIIYNKVAHFVTESKQSINSASSVITFTTATSHFSNSIYSAHAVTDAIYLDFKKVFNSVSHPELLVKLWASGITGDLWLWFQAYLSNHSQLLSVMSTTE